MALPIPAPSGDVFPTTDAALADWTLVFVAAWVPATYNCVDPTAVDLGTLRANYATALNALMTTPSPSNRAAKNTAKAELIQMLRAACRAAKDAYRLGTVTEAQIVALGLRVPKVQPTPINAPVDAPILGVSNVGQGITALRITQVVNGEPVTNRRFPDGVAVAQIQYKIGASGEWTDAESARRVNLSLTTPDVSNGTVLTWRARYATARGLTGPWSATVQTVAML